MCSNGFLVQKDTHSSSSKPMIINRSEATGDAEMISEDTDCAQLKPKKSDRKHERLERNLTAWGTRHTQASIVFMGLSMSFIIRLNLALAIVGMEKSHRFRINFSPGEKALAVSSFFMGYSLLQVPAGNLGRKGYSVKLFSLANILSGILCIVLPLMVGTFSVGGIVVNRFITGILQGFVYPSVNNIMSRWTVPDERDSVMCLVHTGNPFGSLLVMVISGYLDHYFDWPSIFYVTGAFGIACGSVMLIIGRDSPETHCTISSQEKNYIFKSLDEEPDEDYSKVDVPWKLILTSKPVLAMTFCAWCCYWSGWTLSLLTPSYINGVLQIDIGYNGVLSALPYLLCCVLSVIISIISNYLKKSTLISDRIMRPVWNSIGMLGSGIPIVVLAFLPANAKWAIALMTISASLFVACNVGYMVNHIDLSPKFAGVLMSIMNSVGNTASLLGPLVSTYMIKDESSQADWRNVFLLCAFMFLLETLFCFIRLYKKAEVGYGPNERHHNNLESWKEFSVRAAWINERHLKELTQIHY